MADRFPDHSDELAGLDLTGVVLADVLRDDAAIEALREGGGVAHPDDPVLVAMSGLAAAVAADLPDHGPPATAAIDLTRRATRAAAASIAAVVVIATLGVTAATGAVPNPVGILVDWGRTVGERLVSPTAEVDRSGSGLSDTIGPERGSAVPQQSAAPKRLTAWQPPDRTSRQVASTGPQRTHTSADGLPARRQPTERQPTGPRPTESQPTDRAVVEASTDEATHDQEQETTTSADRGPTALEEQPAAGDPPGAQDDSAVRKPVQGRSEEAGGHKKGTDPVPTEEPEPALVEDSGTSAGETDEDAQRSAFRDEDVAARSALAPGAPAESVPGPHSPGEPDDGTSVTP